MELIQITAENLEKEHICCAISSNKDCQVKAKKAWLSERLEEGLVFLKGDVRGKCFIEYIPAEYAWAPVEAEGYMYINCFWVSGQYKGQGNSNLLLEACIRDSREKGKKGLAVLSSSRKLPFLSDPGYLKHKGFLVADTAAPYFELLYLPFGEGGAGGGIPVPAFREQARNPRTQGVGFELYYTCQCPFTAKYVPLVQETARTMGIPFQSILIDRCETAQKAPAAVTSYSLFYDGEFITHEILSVKKFTALAEKLSGS